MPPKRKATPAADGGLFAAIGEAPPAPAVPQQARDALAETRDWAWAHKFADTITHRPVARLTLFFHTEAACHEALTRLGITDWTPEERTRWWPEAPQ